MHYIGIAGHMRRIYDPYQYEFLKPLQPINEFITISAFVLGASQLIFFVNFFWSAFKGPKAERQPLERGRPRVDDAVAAAGTATGRARSPRCTAGRTTTASPAPTADLRDADGSRAGRRRARQVTEVARMRPAELSKRTRRRRPARAATAGLGGERDDARGGGPAGDPAAIPRASGCWAFLGTITMLFIGFTSAYIAAPRVAPTGGRSRPRPCSGGTPPRWS